jgi:hypothetical protein
VGGGPFDGGAVEAGLSGEVALALGLESGRDRGGVPVGPAQQLQIQVPVGHGEAAGGADRLVEGCAARAFYGWPVGLVVEVGRGEADGFEYVFGVAPSVAVHQHLAIGGCDDQGGHLITAPVAGAGAGDGQPGACLVDVAAVGQEGGVDPLKRCPVSEPRYCGRV